MVAFVTVFMIVFGIIGLVGGIILMSFVRNSKSVSDSIPKPTNYQVFVVLFCIFMFGVMVTNLRYLTM